MKKLVIVICLMLAMFAVSAKSKSPDYKKPEADKYVTKVSGYKVIQPIDVEASLRNRIGNNVVVKTYGYNVSDVSEIDINYFYGDYDVSKINKYANKYGFILLVSDYEIVAVEKLEDDTFDVAHFKFDAVVVDNNKAIKDLKVLSVANFIGNLGKNIRNIANCYKGVRNN